MSERKALLDNKLTLILVCSLMLLGHAVRAQETPWTSQDALHEVSSEAAQCSAYYTFAKKCADNSGQTQLSARLENTIKTATDFEFVTGKAAGMSEQALLASAKLALYDAKSAINGSCVNISVLIVRYANSCKLLLEHPDDRVYTLMRGRLTAPSQ